jgi:hypothetical protein
MPGNGNTSSQSWRWLVVATIAAVCSFGSLMAWLFSNADLVGKRGPWPLALHLELFGTFFGMIFSSGRIAARLLINEAAGEEVARSGRWRLVPLQFITGLVLVGSRFTDAGSVRWSVGHVVNILFGVALMAWASWDAWRYWVRPRRQSH